MRTYSARSLVHTYRAARGWQPDTPFIALNDGWGTVLTAAEWLAWFRKKLLAKIESFAPARTGRKLDPLWQRECSRLARAVNTPRLCVRFHEHPVREYRERLAHRFNTED